MPEDTIFKPPGSARPRPNDARCHKRNPQHCTLKVLRTRCRHPQPPWRLPARGSAGLAPARWSALQLHNYELGRWYRACRAYADIVACGCTTWTQSDLQQGLGFQLEVLTIRPQQPAVTQPQVGTTSQMEVFWSWSKSQRSQHRLWRS